MNIEENRLNTFTNWPATAEVGPVRIAKAGFYYTGQGVEVQCFSCGGKISEWEYGDQVMARHRRLDPNCPFVMNPQTSCNVALDLNEPNATPYTTLPRFRELIRDFIDFGADSFQNDLTEEDEMYKNDALRLLSFVNWPENNVSRELLVNAGLYHMGNGRVRCAWCGGEHQGALGPDPLLIHHQTNPHCRHAGEVYLALQEPLVPIPPSPPLPFAETPPEYEPPMSEGAVHNNSILSDNAWQSLGVIGAGSGGARNPANATNATRLATFINWPKHLTQKPAELAEAGFYYTGDGDRVHCYYCDGGLGSWDAGDIPWNEHAKWFPDCGYVTLIKGRDFVEKYKNRNPEARNTATSRPRRIMPRNRTCFANFHPINEEMITEEMESRAALDALGTGLDASRVRRAIIRRLQITGMGYRNSAALINAALDGQFDEEPWSEDQTPQARFLARDVLYNSQGDISSSTISPGQNPSDQPETSGNTDTPTTVTSTMSTPTASTSVQETIEQDSGADVVTEDTLLLVLPTTSNVKKEEKKLTLEEENIKLKQVTMCKVCMDREVSVVFLPCGHLVSCAECGASLGTCPLCRSSVKALVRAYLA